MVSLNFLIISFLLCVITFVFATSCGDDGLYFQCFSEIGDIPVDIAGNNNGTLLALGDDETSSPFNLSFPFRFYANSYTSVLINSNGFLTFDDCCANCTYGGPPCNVPLPMPNANLINTIIAAFWTDLDPSVAGTLHTASDADNFRVQWTNVPQFSSSNNNTFQLHLTSNGDFWFYFRTLEVDSTNFRRIVIGVEDQNGTNGFSVLYVVPGNRSRPATPSRLHFVVNNRMESTTGGTNVSTTSPSISTTGSTGRTNLTTTTSSTGKINSSTTSPGKTNFSTTSIIVEVSSDGVGIFDILLFMGVLCGVCCVCSVLALFAYRRYRRQTRELQPIPTESDDDNSSSSFSSSSSGSSDDDNDSPVRFEDVSLNEDDDEPIVYADISAFDISLASHAILKDV